MFSMLIASKLDSNDLIAFVVCVASLLWLIHTGTTSAFPDNLNSKDLPSIAGKHDFGPIFPNYSTAVPSVTIADNSDVFEYTLSYLINFLRISSVK